MAFLCRSIGGRGGGLKSSYPSEQRQAFAAGVGVQADRAVVEGLADLADEAHEGRLSAYIDDTGFRIDGIGVGAAVGRLCTVDGTFVDL